MARRAMKTLTLLLAALSSVNAYWLMGIEDFITTERIDPIVNPGRVSGHVHSVLGGSNFRMNTNTGALRQSECTSIPIPEDKSNYWFPHLYFQWANGSFTSLDGGAVIYYLFSDTPGTTTAFPDDFRMLTGDPTLRTYDPKSYAQQAVTFLCLDFNGVSTRFNSLPPGNCASGIRAQINFPSCWDGKNVDSSDHKSHVAFPSGGPDSGTCSDPKFPVTLPRIFVEVYWSTNNFDNVRSQAMNSTQPFVYSYGDPTGYGYHADFLNGWDKGVLQKAVDNCHCNPYGDPTCCVDQGIFHMNHGQTCRITKAIDEKTTGTLNKLPGNNPVQKEGVPAKMYTDPNTPALLSPIYAYTGNSPAQVGTVIAPPASGPATASSAHPSSSSTGAATTLTSRSLSSVALPPSSSAGVASSSDIPVSSKPIAIVITSFAPSPTVPSASVVPPALAPHTVSHMTSAIARPSFPSPSDSDEEEDCEEEDDTEEDDSTHSAVPASTNTAASSMTSSAHSTSVPGSSASNTASQSTSAPVQSPVSDNDDEEDCEEEDDDDADGSTSPAPPSSGSGSNHSESVSVDSVQHTPTTTTVSASSTSPGNFLPVASVTNAQPACATEKFRHKRMREQKAQPEKRSFHHARSFHDRLVRSHRARAF